MHSLASTNNQSLNLTKTSKTVVILGNNETGKTNILQRYTKKRFDSNYLETIGVDFYSKEIQTNKDSSLILSLWDTSGSELDLKVLPSNIYKIASGFFLVCSYDSIKSLNDLQKFLNFILNFFNLRVNGGLNNNNNNKIPIIVLVNKSDLKNKKFSLKDVYLTIENFNYSVYVHECSALSNLKIDFIFQKMIDFILGKASLANESLILYEENIDEETKSINLNNGRRKSFQLNLKEIKGKFERKKEKGCC